MVGFAGLTPPYGVAVSWSVGRVGFVPDPAVRNGHSLPSQSVGWSEARTPNPATP